MLIILAIVISVAALLIVAYPILVSGRTTQPASATHTAQEALAELLARRDAVFQALRDLNFDHQVGKVADDDFAIFETNLKEDAANTLRALDAWEAQANSGLDAVMERTIAARRLALTTNSRVCPSCGRSGAAADQFCAACGVALPSPQPPANTTCLKCGRPFDPNDRFCAGCGTTVLG